MGGKANLVALLGVGLIVANFWLGWQRQAFTGVTSGSSSGTISFS